MQFKVACFCVDIVKTAIFTQIPATDFSIEIFKWGRRDPFVLELRVPKKFLVAPSNKGKTLPQI